MRRHSQFAERERLGEMAFDVIAQTPPRPDRQAALQRDAAAPHALRLQQQTQHFMRGFVGTQQAVGIVPMLVGERLT